MNTTLGSNVLELGGQNLNIKQYTYVYIYLFNFFLPYFGTINNISQVHLMTMFREKEEYVIMNILMFYLYKHHYHELLEEDIL